MASIAAKTARDALNWASWMMYSGEYESCDWCCGGGDELRGRLMARVRKAQAQGVNLPERCERCHYFDQAKEGASLCDKCDEANL